MSKIISVLASCITMFALLMAVDAFAYTFPRSAAILADLEVNHNLMTNRQGRSSQPIRLVNLLIPTSARSLRLDLDRLRPEIRKALLVNIRGQMYYRWLLNSEDQSFGQQLRAQLRIDGVPFTEESRFVGLLTASRSTLAIDPESGIVFSYKSPTDKTGGVWTEGKGLEPEEARGYRFISDHINQLYVPEVNKSFFYIPEPGMAAYLNAGQATLIRDYDFENLEKGGRALIPLTAILQSEFGQTLAQMNGAQSQDEILEFIDRVYAIWGRALAEMIANFGIIMTSAHPQNFGAEVRLVGGKMILTGRMGVRDGGNSSLFVPGMGNSSYRKEIIRRYKAQLSDTIRVQDKDFFLLFGPYNGIAHRPSWINHNYNRVRQSTNVAFDAASERFHELTGIQPDLRVSRGFQNNPDGYMVRTSRFFTPGELSGIEAACVKILNGTRVNSSNRN